MRLERSGMKRTRFFVPMAVAIGLTAAVCAASALQNSSQHKVLFEKAKFTMETKGDLKGAIGLFEEIIKKYPNERDYAAKSQLYIGMCYEKLGQEQASRAQKAFEKVVENYPEQAEAVKVANEKLAIIARVRPLVAKGAGEFGIRKLGRFDGQAVSSDGRLIAYVDWESRPDVAVMELGTGEKRRLTNVDKGFVDLMVFSPDSRRLAFGWYRDNDPFRVGIIDCDGSGQRIIFKAAPGEYFWPKNWTPDQKSIVGVLEKGSIIKQLAMISVADGAVRNLKKLDEAWPGVDLSPDGRWIAFDQSPAGPRGSRDIFLLEIENNREIPLIKHPGDDRLLGWSPNGRWVLFSSDRSGSWDAWILRVDGGKATGDPILVKQGFGAPGRPGGTVGPMGFTKQGAFYYSQGTWQEDVHVAEFELDRPNLKTSFRKVSLTFEGANCYPDWSPDGSLLAYRSIRKPAGPESHALCILSVEKGEQRELFPPILFSQLSWHPDGKSVVVIGYDADGRAGLFRVDAGTGEASFIVEGGESRPTAFAPRYSPNGDLVYYTIDLREQDACQILMYDLQTRQKKELYRGSVQINRMDISPDGKHLAFWEIGGNALKIIPTAGGKPAVLHEMEKGEGINGITWSPDGKYIFFSKWRKGGGGKTGPCDLWRISKDGGTPVKYELTVNGMENLGIPPDGKRLAFNSWEVRSEVWVMENFLPEEGPIRRAK
jgi:Tol biopolymer transport system component